MKCFYLTNRPRFHATRDQTRRIVHESGSNAIFVRFLDASQTLLSILLKLIHSSNVSQSLFKNFSVEGTITKLKGTSVENSFFISELPRRDLGSFLGGQNSSSGMWPTQLGLGVGGGFVPHFICKKGPEIPHVTIHDCHYSHPRLNKT